MAVEPATEMIRQRPKDAAAALSAVAEALPFADGTFDGAMALLTIHHWPDQSGGLAELRRVTRGPVVVLTFDKGVHDQQWLCTDYLPTMGALDPQLLSPVEIAGALGGGVVEVLPVPHDCFDGFCHAWWRRPKAYLDPEVRAGISGIARLPAAVVTPAMAALAEDLATGAWHRNHADLISCNEIDAGYRIVVSPGP